jgi:hypothetical protein
VSVNDRQCSAGVTLGHSVVFSDANRFEVDHEFPIVLPAMNVRWIVVPRVDSDVEAMISKNGWHLGSIVPRGRCFYRECSS